VDPGLAAEVGQPKLRVFSDPTELASGAADLFAGTVKQAAAKRGMARIALSGGSTPKAMYDALAVSSAESGIPWDKVQVFFSDERFVAPESDESNYHLAQVHLLSKVPIPDRFVHRVATVDVSAAESAGMYEEGIRRVFEVGLDETPAFDLVFLGLGPDGHTASLFPGTEALGEMERLVVSNYVPQLESWRITFTYRLINAAAEVAFLVQGQKKAGRVAQVLRGDADLPASGVRSSRVLWLLDRGAASEFREPADPA